MIKNSVRQRDYVGVELIKFLCSILVFVLHVPFFSRNGNMDILNSLMTNYISGIAVPYFLLHPVFSF